MKTTKHPVRRLLSSLLFPRKPIANIRADFRRTPLLHREESLNKIFMVRYRMQNL